MITNKSKKIIFFRNFIPTHAFLKFEWENDELVLYMFSYDRLQELFDQNRIRIRHQQFDDYLVITASTDELQKFIRKYADDEKAFETTRRELKEETGLSASKWENIMRIHTSNSATDEEGFVFLARQLTQGETEFEDTEDLKIWKSI